MAEKTAVVENYLTCAVCLDTFEEPVTLGCNHSFCYSCLHNYWEQNNTKNCPVCRRRSSKDAVVVNFALKDLSISFTEKQKSEVQTGETPVCTQQTGETPVCRRHPEVPPLFCKDEQQLLCPVCEFFVHKQHMVVSVETAVSELKGQLRSELQSLREKKDQVEAVKQNYKEMLQHSEKQAESCERQIRAVFQRLHHFLKEEEESRLATLREEQHRQAQTISPELERIREQLSSLSHSIQALEQQLQRDRGDFLHTYRQTQSHSQASQADPQLVKGLLINEARVLGNMGFKVWEKMKNKVHYSPVILDPNTAAPHVCLSEDLTSMTFKKTNLQLFENPERFTRYPIILGSEGFSSGTHSWDVEVGDYPHWVLGVANESVDRKGNYNPSQTCGFWGFAYVNDEYFADYMTVNLKKHPQKIRVLLDYDNGAVCFYDVDNMSPLSTYAVTFTEKVFPYFCVGPHVGNAESQKIRICPKQSLVW